MELRLNDGRTLSKEVDTSRGTPERPMTTSELADKFHDCAQGIIPHDNQAKALSMVYQLEDVSDVSQLTALLRG